MMEISLSQFIILLGTSCGRFDAVFFLRRERLMVIVGIARSGYVGWFGIPRVCFRIDLWITWRRGFRRYSDNFLGLGLRAEEGSPIGNWILL